MAVLTRVSESEARSFVARYSLGEFVSLVGIPAGSVNSNFALEVASGRYFLRVYEEQDHPGAIAEAKLLVHLASSGIPVAAPVLQRNGEPIGELAGKPAAIFHWLAGGMRCQASVSPSEASRVGRALARIHVAGEGVARAEGRFRPEDLVRRLDIIAGATDPELAAQAKPLREKLAAWGARRDPALPRGLIHGDLFRDNVLWESESPSAEISALLDFESASDGVFAYDLMVTALAWCVGHRLEPSLLRAMIAGYESVRPLTAAERTGLLAEGCLAALRFTITRITDYAMRVTDGPRVIKQWRRFALRLDALEALGEEGMAAVLRG